PAAVDDQTEELEVNALGRRTARPLVCAVGAAGRRPAAAVGVAGRARVPVPVVAVTARAELVDGAVLAVAAGVERTRRHVEPHGRRAGVGERPADELPVLAAVAPAPASARREVRLHPEGLALGGRIDARVQRGLESPYAASR